MKDILPDLENWLANGDKVALATVVQTWGSSPRAAGAKMALTPDGKITGSVSGGCVEGAVYEAGIESLKTGQPRLLHFGVADEMAWTVGLACGGQIDVFVQLLRADCFEERRKRLESGQPFAAATMIRGPAHLLGRDLLVSKTGAVTGSISAELDSAVATLAGQALREGGSRIVPVRVDTPGQPGEAAVTQVRAAAASAAATADLAVPAPVRDPGSVLEPAAPIGEPAAPVGEPRYELFIEVVEPQPVLVIVGAVHTAIALSKLAEVMGFRTVVVDPRKAFGNESRFPNVDQLLQVWPEDAFSQLEIHEQTAIAILTHDPKIDDPALLQVLSSPAFYIGALGSPTTQAKRRQRLLEAGVSGEQLARLHGPIGLKLGGRTPEEIALAVMAEIIAVKNRVID